MLRTFYATGRENHNQVNPHMDPHDIRKCQTALKFGEIFNWDDGRSTHSVWPLPTLQSRFAFPDEFILDHGERWASGVVVALRCGVCGCQPLRLEPAGVSRTQPSPWPSIPPQTNDPITHQLFVLHPLIGISLIFIASCKQLVQSGR